jgi:hypothetical protein
MIDRLGIGPAIRLPSGSSRAHALTSRVSWASWVESATPMAEVGAVRGALPGAAKATLQVVATGDGVLVPLVYACLPTGCCPVVCKEWVKGSPLSAGRSWAVRGSPTSQCGGVRWGRSERTRGHRRQHGWPAQTSQGSRPLPDPARAHEVDGSAPLTVAWVFLRAELRRRWRTWLSVALLAAAFAGRLRLRQPGPGAPIPPTRGCWPGARPPTS